MASPFTPALTGRWLKSSFQPKGYAAFLIYTLFDRTSSFKDGAQLVYDELSPYTNLRNDAGYKAVAVYIGPDILDESDLGPTYRLLVSKLSGRSDTDEDKILIWYKDGSGHTKFYPAQTAKAIDRVSSESPVSIVKAAD